MPAYRGRSRKLPCPSDLNFYGYFSNEIYNSSVLLSRGLLGLLYRFVMDRTTMFCHGVESRLV